MRNQRLLLGLSILGSAYCLSREELAWAGDFDSTGHFVKDAKAVAFEDFQNPTRFIPDGTSTACMDPEYVTQTEDDALSGTDDVLVHVTGQGCAERFSVTLPATKASYRATIWVRHGASALLFDVTYPTSSNKGLTSALFAPTGRATSDGWVELSTNDFPYDGTIVGDDQSLPVAYVRVLDYADDVGMDVDALEVVPSGEFFEDQSCAGAHDPVCGTEAVCIGGVCVDGQLNVPPFPDEAARGPLVDAMEGQLNVFFGGQKTRTVDLPNALAQLETIRSATTPWQFWNGWATAIHKLHDWHTDTGGSIQQYGPSVRLTACFIEGDADLSHGIVPSDPSYKDIIVAYVGAADNAGLHAGDRLVAIDGQHPIAWGRSLIDVNWGYHIASDSDSFADFAEALGDGGGGLITSFAKELTVIRCNGTDCSAPPETIQVKDLTADGNGFLRCDNRPFYHLGATGPDPTRHNVGGKIYTGAIDGTTVDEAIYGMVWDTLDGEGDPASKVNTALTAGITLFETKAKGVILDHRAGNGGTLDSAELMTGLTRPPGVAAVIRMPIASAGYVGPADTTEGLALFDAAPAVDKYTEGSSTYAQFPIALVTHRDGSASDYMPYAMKGSPHLKIFGPGPTAGAFSTFIQFTYGATLSYQFASGDTISSEGISLMGKGVMPDVMVQQKQSDIIAGKDSIHEAALAWIRSENAQ